MSAYNGSISSIRHPGYRPDIDGLRAVAVVSVVLFHAEFPFLPGGFVGVDIFFVISGYLISGVLVREISDGRFTLANFYERRIRRIFPALFVMLAATLAAGWLLLGTRSFQQLGASAAAASLSLSNVFFYLRTGYFDLAAFRQPLLHTWSLAVEEQFYLGFPIYLILVKHLGRLSWARSIALVIALSFAVNLLLVVYSPKAAFYLPFGRLWELALGGLAATISEAQYRRLPSYVAEAATGIGALLLAISLLFITPQMRFPDWVALAPCIGTVLIIAGGTVGQTVIGRALSWRLCTGIGLISYSLYLWHWPILVYLRLAADRPPEPWVTAAAVVAGVAVSFLSWRFVEQPVRLRRDVFTRPLLFAGSAASIVAMCALAVAIWTMQGVPSRLHPLELRADNGATDTNPTRSACDAPSLERIAADDICVLGAKGTPPRFALIGDSFADALSPAIVQAASEAGESIMIYTHSGCRPLIGLIARADCGDPLRAAIAAIRENPQVDTVILAGRWPQLTEGTRFGMVEQFDGWLIDGKTVVPGPEESARVFGRALAGTVEGLKGKRVVVVTGVPEQQVIAPEATIARLRLSLPPPHGIDRQTVDRRYRNADTVIGQMAEANIVDVLDLRPSMCSTDECPVVSGETIRYVDDNHPSRTQSIAMHDRFLPIFQDAQ